MRIIAVNPIARDYGIIGADTFVVRNHELIVRLVKRDGARGRRSRDIAQYGILGLVRQIHYRNCVRSIQGHIKCVTVNRDSARRGAEGSGQRNTDVDSAHYLVAGGIHYRDSIAIGVGHIEQAIGQSQPGRMQPDPDAISALSVSRFTTDTVPVLAVSVFGSETIGIPAERSVKSPA